MMKTSLYLLTLISLLIPSSLISANKDYVRQFELIKKTIPPLLRSAGSVSKIEITLHKDGIKKSHIINDQDTINIISSSLNETILSDNYRIGRQWHQPSINLAIKLILKEKDPIHLTWVGMSMFWITWNEKMRKNHDDINFQSKEFERVFFTWSFLNTLSGD